MLLLNFLNHQVAAPTALSKLDIILSISLLHRLWERTTETRIYEGITYLFKLLSESLSVLFYLETTAIATIDQSLTGNGLWDLIEFSSHPPPLPLIYSANILGICSRE